MEPAKREINGTELNVFEAGSGETLLFLHGAGGSNWSPLLQLLAEKHRVLAPEHPGFGRSQIPDWMMGVGDLAFFYLDFLEKLDLKNVHLVGHSLGGWTAAEIAVRNTSRLKSLTLLAPAGVRSPTVPFGDIFLWSPEEHARHMFHDKKFVDERIKQLATMDQDIWLQNRAAGARLAWNPRLNNPQLAYWLHRIDVPTHFIWGKNDEICPFDCAQYFVKPIKHATLEAMDQTGHALHTEKPKEVAEKVTAFIAKALDRRG
ncbi:MAG TPA: alpha/beta fold hydrolase [Stellaceae bacterium]|nr:alpha/beta fold hydrolase [Stellaceae bacterium]